MIDDGAKDFSGVLGQLVAEMNAKEETDSKERRRNDRVSFEHIQRFAPYGDQLPRYSDFCEMRCHNLSVGGIAFFWDDQPDFDSVVFALGKEPQFLYVTGRIIRVVPYNREFLLCCRFLGRLHTEIPGVGDGHRFA